MCGYSSRYLNNYTQRILKMFFLNHLVKNYFFIVSVKDKDVRAKIKANFRLILYYLSAHTSILVRPITFCVILCNIYIIKSI